MKSVKNKFIFDRFYFTCFTFDVLTFDILTFDVFHTFLLDIICLCFKLNVILMNIVAKGPILIDCKLYYGNVLNRTYQWHRYTSFKIKTNETYIFRPIKGLRKNIHLDDFDKCSILFLLSSNLQNLCHLIFDGLCLFV